MFTTPKDVLAATGKTVTNDDIKLAQFAIEIYIGKIEADVKKVSDKSLLGRATIAQVVYMGDNYDKVYEQIKVAQQTNNGSSVTYRAGDNASPFIAPLALMACDHLSWLKSRSVHTGRIFQGSKTRLGWFRD